MFPTHAIVDEKTIGTFGSHDNFSILDSYVRLYLLSIHVAPQKKKRKLVGPRNFEECLLESGILK